MAKDRKELSVRDELTEFLLYTTPNQEIKVETFLHKETVWLTQKRMAKLFGVQRPAVTKHLSNIFKEGELEEHSVCSILEHTAEDGKTYKTKYYNLDAILSVGYRVNSIQATRFRQWATTILKEYIIKGFNVDDDRSRKWAEESEKRYQLYKDGQIKAISLEDAKKRLNKWT